MTHWGPTTLTVVTGPMFAAKSDTLINVVRSFEYARIPKERIIVCKSALDTRTEGTIATRRIKNEESVWVDSVSAVPIRCRADFLRLTVGDEYDALIVDEAQLFPLDTPLQDSFGWFGRDLRELLHRRRNTSLQVIVAGLDTTADDMPFGPMAGIMAIADEVKKLKGICMECGAPGAAKSHRTTAGSEQIVIGDIGTYQVRCRACFIPTSAA